MPLQKALWVVVSRRILILTKFVKSNKDKHTVFSPISLSGWNHFVSVKIKHWEYFYTDWIKSKEAKILVVHFENLIDNLEWNLLRILDFLDFESDQQRLQCVLRNAEGQFHRRAKNSTMRWGNQIKFGDSGLFTFSDSFLGNQ